VAEARLPAPSQQERGRAGALGLPAKYSNELCQAGLAGAPRCHSSHGFPSHAVEPQSCFRGDKLKA